MVKHARDLELMRIDSAIQQAVMAMDVEQLGKELAGKLPEDGPHHRGEGVGEARIPTRADPSKSRDPSSKIVKD